MLQIETFTIYSVVKMIHTICSHTIYGMLRKSNTIYSHTIYSVVEMIHTRQVKVGVGSLKIAKVGYLATQLPTLIEKMSYLL